MDVKFVRCMSNFAKKWREIDCDLNPIPVKCNISAVILLGKQIPFLNCKYSRWGDYEREKVSLNLQFSKYFQKVIGN